MLNVNPTSLSLDNVGAAYAQNFIAQETSYTGAFTETDTCGGIATIVPSAGKGPSTTYTVTGLAAGTCSVTIGDSFNQKAVVSVTVTSAGFVIQSKRRQH